MSEEKVCRDCGEEFRPEMGEPDCPECHCCFECAGPPGACDTCAPASDADVVTGEQVARFGASIKKLRANRDVQLARCRGMVEKLSTALERLRKDEWRVTVDWGPRDERDAIYADCEEALAEARALLGQEVKG